MTRSHEIRGSARLTEVRGCGVAGTETAVAVRLEQLLAQPAIIVRTVASTKSRLLMTRDFTMLSGAHAGDKLSKLIVIESPTSVEWPRRRLDDELPDELSGAAYSVRLPACSFHDLGQCAPLARFKVLVQFGPMGCKRAALTKPVSGMLQDVIV